MFIRLIPAPLVAPRNFAPARNLGTVTALLRAPLPGGAGTRLNAFRSDPDCSLGAEAKRAIQLLQTRNAKSEHDRKSHLIASDRQPDRQANQIPITATGVENCFFAGMPDTRPTSNVRHAGRGG